MSQRELAYVVGISVPTLVRLEAKRVKDPPLSWYVNCAIALGVRLVDVLEEDLMDDATDLRRQWTEINTRQLPPENWRDRVGEGTWYTPALTPAARRLQRRPD